MPKESPQATLEIPNAEIGEVGTAVQPHRPTPAGVAPVASIYALLDRAIERGVPVESLERLQQMFQQEQDRSARREFNNALASFQAECPPIKKKSKAAIETSSGAKYTYTYAELDEIARTVRPLLHKRGLSYGWDSSVEGTTLKCVCTLRHENGHSITSTFTCPTDTPSKMSGQQKVASALTFARRQSLVEVLGLTTTDQDDDTADPTPITAEQCAELQALMAQHGVTLPRFLKWAKKATNVEALADLPARAFTSAVNVIKGAKKDGAA